VCPSISPSLSVRHKPVYCIETTERIELVLAWGYLTQSRRPALCYKEISVSPKIRVLPPGTLPQTPDFKISPRQVDRVVNKTRRRRRRQQICLSTTPIYDNRRVAAVYYKSVNCNPLTPFIVKVKVKFSDTRYRALGPELIPVYRQSARR